MSSETVTAHPRPYKLRKRADSMAATRERITVAAVDLHGTVGPARTTITAVAERAGVQRQTVYRHFATEEELFAACSGHFFSTHPWPLIDDWRAIADPRERLERGLDELYAYYEQTETMFTNVFRDEELVPSMGSAIRSFRAHLNDAASAFAQGWGVRGKRQAVLIAAARHAVDFATWRSLAHDGGVGRAQAVDLTATLVRRAAEGDRA